MTCPDIFFWNQAEEYELDFRSAGWRTLVLM